MKVTKVVGNWLQANIIRIKIVGWITRKTCSQNSGSVLITSWLSEKKYQALQASSMLAFQCVGAWEWGYISCTILFLASNLRLHSLEWPGNATTYLHSPFFLFFFFGFIPKLHSRGTRLPLFISNYLIKKTPIHHPIGSSPRYLQTALPGGPSQSL